MADEECGSKAGSPFEGQACVLRDKLPREGPPAVAAALAQRPKAEPRPSRPPATRTGSCQAASAGRFRYLRYLREEQGGTRNLPLVSLLQPPRAAGRQPFTVPGCLKRRLHERSCVRGCTGAGGPALSVSSSPSASRTLAQIREVCTPPHTPGFSRPGQGVQPLCPVGSEQVCSYRRRPSPHCS